MVSPVETAFLNAAVSLLLQKLASQGVRDFIWKKHDEDLPEKLTETLTTLNGLLADAEEKQVTVAAVKNWHDDVKDAVYEAEDLLDEIEYEARRSVLEAGSQTGPVQVRNFFSSLNPFNKEKEEMDKNLKKVFLRLERLEKKAHTLHLIKDSVQRPAAVLSLPTTSQLGGTSVYGRDDAKEDIMDSLLSDDAKSKKLEVIPIVGMGGVGKTTLAKLVYNDVNVQEWFDLKAWVYVSPEFDVLKVTREILKGVSCKEFRLSECDSMTPDLLQCQLKEKLLGNKLLLVLDNVWSGDQEHWEFLLAPLSSGAKGSKIIVTTRDKSIASIVQSALPYPLKGISDADCWSLFTEHAFSGENGKVSSQNEEIGRKIVQRCSGLPLAAKSLGSLLKSKRDVEEWKKISKSKIRDLQNGNILPSLRLSYYYLPSYLKRCFAYCAILTKGCTYKKEELVHLWMAEGFSVQPGWKDMKEAGNEYFQNLLSRSLFEQSSDHSSHFFMHDLTNELAKFVSGEFSLNLDDDSPNISSKTRHVSYARISCKELNKVEGIDVVRNLRTFYSISEKSLWDGIDNVDIHSLLARFKRLRVLSFSNYALIDELPDSIGNLKHLRYLNLSETSIERLPEIVCTLYNLQTLILRCCTFFVELPANLTQLTNLYHLDIKDTILQQMPLHIGKLTKLQMLTDFFVGTWDRSNIKELGELNCLRGEISIWNLQNVIDARGSDLQGKNDLKKLELRWAGNTTDSRHERGVLEQLQPHTNLEDLAIVGYGGTTFPDWVGDSSFSNIVALELRDCRYCSFLPPLGQLASLKRLLIEEFDEVEVVGSEFYGGCTSAKDSFKSLENLTFERMSQWKKWITEGSSFPRLKVLCLISCPNLITAPFSHLASLVELKIEECPQLELSLPRSQSLNKITLRDNYVREMQLKKLPSGNHSLSVESLHSDSLLEELMQLSRFLTIQRIDITRVSLKCFPLNLLPKLKQLEIRECEHIESLCAQEEPFSDSTSISSLKICECPDLEKLSLSNCSNLKAVHCILPCLVNLEIRYCEELESFPGGCLSSKLESLGISHCNRLFAGRQQWDLQKLSSLASLSFGGCEEVESFPEEEMSLPSTLTSLEMWDLQNLKSLDCKGLQHLTLLRKFRIKLCPELQSTSTSSSQICEFPNMEVLSLYDCQNLKSMHCLLPSLVNLEIANCEELESFPGEVLSKLESLTIHSCKKLWAGCKKADMQKLRSLSSFFFSDCEEVESFPEEGMLMPPAVTSLTITNLLNLKSLNSGGLQRLTGLRTLGINNCPKLQSMPEEGLPDSLTRLSIMSCSLLGERCQRETGEDWPKIRRIPEININFKKIN